ncbi:hypothetical protein ACROYT_G011156 [Oculina patagonica]
MADELKIESQDNFHTELFYEYDSSSSNSRSGSLEFLLTVKKESFVEEIHFAQALFPEFFVNTAMKGYCTNFKKNSLVCINNASAPKKKHCKQLDSDAIETWYIKEYGLLRVTYELTCNNNNNNNNNNINNINNDDDDDDNNKTLQHSQHSLAKSAKVLLRWQLQQLDLTEKQSSWFFGESESVAR